MKELSKDLQVPKLERDSIFPTRKGKENESFPLENKGNLKTKKDNEKLCKLHKIP